MNTYLLTYQRYMGAVNYALSLLFLFTLAFPWHITQPIAVAWLIAWLLEGRWLQRSNWQFSRNQIPLVLMGVFVLWEIISMLWTIDMPQARSEISRHLPLFGFILIGACGINPRHNTIALKTALYLGCLTAIVSYLMIVFWAKTNIYYTIYSEWVPFNPWTLLSEGPIGLIKHRLYLCIPLALSLCFSICLYRHYREKYTPLTAALTISIGDCILLAAIVLTGSRTTILLIPILLIAAIFMTLKGKKRWICAVSCLALLLIVGSIFWKYNSRFILTKNQVHSLETEQLKNNPTPFTNTEPRLYIWTTVVSHWREYGVKGLGVGSAAAFMISCYEQDQVACYYGPHNAYLNTWMELGPLALLLLLGILIATPCCHIGTARRDAFWVCLILGWSMLTETCHTRMAGLYIIYAMIVLIQVATREADSLPQPHP